MVCIHRFKGLRYNLQQLGEEALEKVVSPPYDVIDSTMQQQLLDRHPQNVVRIDLNPIEPTDTETSNRYTRSAELFRQWQAQNILTPEDQPALYAYSQQFTFAGQAFVRHGFFALLQLEAFENRQVLPHEFTLGGPKVDRIKLTQATQANLSPVFLLYDDPALTLEHAGFYDKAFDDETASGWHRLTTHEEGTVTHAFRVVTDVRLLGAVEELLKTKPALIADGHHRYETALMLQQEAREAFRAKNGYEAPSGSLMTDYILAFFSNLADDGLQVFPTHRILTVMPESFGPENLEPESFASLQAFEAALLERFKVVPEVEADFVYETTSQRLPLKLLDPSALSHLPPEKQTLDVVILEEIVFKGLLKRSQEQLKESHHLAFERLTEADTRILMRKNGWPAVFYMQAPNLRLIQDICLSGERMPQKSTYFYPKILTGLLFYSYQPFANTPGHALDYLVRHVPVVHSSNFW